MVDNASIQTDSSNDEEEHKNEIKKMRVSKTRRNPEAGIELPVAVNGVGFYVDPDTSADLNLFDESHYRMIKEKNPQMELKKVKQKVIAANNTSVPIKGKFDETMYNKTRQVETEAFVMNGSLDGAELLLEATLLDLGCIKYDPEGKFQPPNIFTINHINTDNEDVLKSIALPEPTIQEEKEGFQEMRNLIKDRSEMFKGVGCFKKYQVHLELKEDARPIIQKPRQIPIHYQDQIKRRLEEFIREDIMEWCPADQAMTFVSPIHVCPKPNKPGEIRITADYQCLNKNLSRTRIVQKPKVDHYINKLSQCKCWFKLDLPHAYHQLELDEDIRGLNTMSTVWGNVRMKRPSMGLLNAQDFYDERMYHLLHDIKNTGNYRDDIIGGGKTLRSMIKTLPKVLQRLNENGLTLSQKKFHLTMKSVEFLGYVFTQDGLKPNLVLKRLDV